MTELRDDIRALLKRRADSYGSEAAALRHADEPAAAVVYETIAAELRAVADSLAAEAL